jgi:lipid-binding SYLF domain-containing protein
LSSTKEEKINMLMPMIRNTTRFALAGAVAAMATSFPAWSQESSQQRGETQADVVAVQATLANLMRDPDAKWFQENIGKAKGVLLSSEVLPKARVLKSGAGGRSVLLVKGADGKWHGPAFYSIVTEPTAFKEGVKAVEVAALVMTDKGLNTLMAGGGKLGGDLSYAAGPVGAGAPSAVTADVVGFTRVKGVYGGLNLDGTVVAVANDWNKAYFGKDVLPPDILIRMSVTNKQADPLLAAVTKATMK